MPRNPKDRQSILKKLPSLRTGVSKESKSEPSRRERGQQATRKKRALAALVTLMLIVIVTWSVSSTRTSVVVIEILTTEGSFVPVEKDNIRSGIETYLDESFINRWFVNPSRLEAAVKNASNGAVAETTVSFRRGNELGVEISTRKRAVIWEKDGQFFEVDTSGAVFRQSDKSALKTNVHVLDTSKIPVELGANVASSPFMNQIEAIVDTVNQLDGFDLNKFIAPDAARELHFRIAGQPYIVKTQVDQNPEVVGASLSDTLKYMKRKGIKPKEYIDLRVEGRAVYR